MASWRRRQGNPCNTVISLSNSSEDTRRVLTKSEILEMGCFGFISKWWKMRQKENVLKEYKRRQLEREEECWVPIYSIIPRSSSISVNLMKILLKSLQRINLTKWYITDICQLITKPLCIYMYLDLCRLLWYLFSSSLLSLLLVLFSLSLLAFLLFAAWPRERENYDPHHSEEDMYGFRWKENSIARVRYASKPCGCF